MDLDTLFSKVEVCLQDVEKDLDAAETRLRNEDVQKAIAIEVLAIARTFQAYVLLEQAKMVMENNKNNPFPFDQ